MVNITLLLIGIVLWAFTGFLTLVSVKNTFARFKSVHFISVAFFLAFLGFTSLIVRTVVEEWWDLGLNVTVMFHSLAFAMVWFHFELQRHENLHYGKIYGLALLTTIAGFSLLLWIITEEKQLFSFISILSMMLVAFPATLIPARLSFKEYKENHLKKQFYEGVAFLLVLIGLIMFFYVSMFRLFDQPIYFASLGVASFGIIILAIIYAREPAYLYRIPFKIYYLVGYLDSGLCFYQKKLQHRDLKLKENDLDLLSGIMSTIESLFTHILQQEITKTIHYGTNVTVLFKRNTKKKITYIIVAQRASWYLQKALDRLLAETPIHIFPQSEADALNVQKVGKILDPLVQKLFPYFTLLSTP